MANANYPVPGRSADRNARIAAHEIGHAICTRAVNDIVHLVSIIPADNFAGRCVRSGALANLTFDESADSDTAKLPDESISILERLENLGPPGFGTPRAEIAEYYVLCMNNIIGLCGGQAGELILHPDVPPLGGTEHDFDEAVSFARVAVIAPSSKPATVALLEYAHAEATAILVANRDIAVALVEALIEAGELSGESVDQIIADTIAARAVEAEKIRRNDWQARIANAATFQVLQ